MTKEEAYTLLSYHSGRNEDIENEKWKNGFLGCLRPFRGQLTPSNFVEIMECLKVVEDDFMGDAVQSTLLSDVMNIIHLGRRWTEDGSMLASNGCITPEQQRTII